MPNPMTATGSRCSPWMAGGSHNRSNASNTTDTATNTRKMALTNPARISYRAYPYVCTPSGFHRAITDAYNPINREALSKNMCPASEIRPSELVSQPTAISTNINAKLMPRKSAILRELGSSHTCRASRRALVAKGDPPRVPPPPPSL